MAQAVQKSRSFEDDPDYNPAWRSVQALEYKHTYEKAVLSSERRDFALPPTEDDEYVIDYFSYLVHGTCRYPGIKYAHSCFNSNPSRGFGTSIQSMLIGGCSIERIAKEFHTKEENILAYVKLFFDVVDYLDCEPLIMNMIAPFDRHRTLPEELVSNSIWMGLSYTFGWDSAKYILQRRIDIDDSIVDKIVNCMKKSLQLQASEFTMGVRLTSRARPSDFDRYIAYNNTLSLQQGEDQNSSMKESRFRDALWDMVKDVSADLPTDHPVREMITNKEMELIEVKRTNYLGDKTQSFHVPQPL